MYTTAMGYRMPDFYSSVEEEARNVRQRVGMNGVSLMGRLVVKGKDALALVQYLIVNNAAALTDGQAHIDQRKAIAWVTDVSSSFAMISV